MYQRTVSLVMWYVELLIHLDIKYGSGKTEPFKLTAASTYLTMLTLCVVKELLSSLLLKDYGTLTYVWYCQ